jgi:L-alanine-DL-glutamate epimerase-like enolase superfamily enzyme
MRDLAIERIKVYAIGPETERLAWASDMSVQYMTLTILRLTTRGGLEGIAGAASYSEYGFDSAVAETLRRRLPPLHGASPLAREALWQRMVNHNLPVAPQAHSMIDIALWDLAAKAADLPLYRFLGGARDRILAYASTPLYADVPAYLDNIARLKEEGFHAIKLHCWCERKRDMAMVRAVQKRFGGARLNFMLDVEQRYSRLDALRAGEELEELGFTWFEAPLPDVDLTGYRELRERISVPIIPAGNSVLDTNLIALALEMGCWSSARVDATVAGGITPTRKVMALAEAHAMTAELQCWGYTLTQAANLHLMLAYPNCTYFEQPVPYPPFEYGTRNPIRTDHDGYVHAPQGPGLGVEVDWPAMESAAFLQYEQKGHC